MTERNLLTSGDEARKNDENVRMPPPPGSVIASRYLLERVIGLGGTGVVYAARHLALNKRVALKFLRAESRTDRDAVGRFVREAHATALLRSEHVTRVLDAEIFDGSLAFIVMEYLEGRDLARTLEQDGALSPACAVDFLLQACEAIAEAHARNIIHRDIKPSNLFLTRGMDGLPFVKVLDFGFSKVGWSTAALTSKNRVLGSPYFMSPEQLRASRDVDLRSDIWSLGVVLFTLLTGQCPFRGEYVMDVCAAVLSGEMSDLRQLRSEVPQGLAAVVLRCLQLEPCARYQTVTELAEALRAFAPNLGVDRAQRVARIVEAAEAAPCSTRNSSHFERLIGASSPCLNLDTASILVVEPDDARPSPPLDTEAPSTPSPQKGRWAVLWLVVALVVLGIIGLIATNRANAPGKRSVTSPAARVLAPERISIVESSQSRREER